MNYAKPIEALVASSMVAALAAGCAVEGGYTAPKPERPNHTLEQVEHNLDYADQLGNLTLHQKFSFKPDPVMHPKEHVDVYNFTNTRVDPRKFKAVVRVMQSQGLKPLIKEVPIHPRDGHKTVQVKVNQYSLPVKERDFVLVPTEQVLPKTLTYDTVSGLEDTGLSAATRDFDRDTGRVSQRISVIQRPTDYNYAPARFLGQYDDSLPTEICQSMIDAFDGNKRYGGSIYDQMVQETVCNDMGQAVAAAEYGDYDLYKMLEPDQGGTVDFAGNDYWVDPVTLSRSAFTALARQLRQ